MFLPYENTGLNSLLWNSLALYLISQLGDSAGVFRFCDCMSLGPWINRLPLYVGPYIGTFIPYKRVCKQDYFQRQWHKIKDMPRKYKGTSILAPIKFLRHTCYTFHSYVDFHYMASMVPNAFSARPVFAFGYCCCLCLSVCASLCAVIIRLSPR